jgi:hypothetical protein
LAGNFSRVIFCRPSGTRFTLFVEPAVETAATVVRRCATLKYFAVFARHSHRLLLREAVQRAEAPDQIHGVNAGGQNKVKRRIQKNAP